MTLTIPGLPFAADPLIAEAKWRRRRRLLAAGLALVLAMGSIVLGVEVIPRGAGLVGGASPTNLTLSAVSDFGGRTVFDLTCHPAGGNLPQPARACATVAAQPGLITDPKPFPCWGNGWVFSIIGRLNGQPVHTRVASCWTRQMALVKFDPRFAQRLAPRMGHAYIP
jgi:hypothetical protein